VRYFRLVLIVVLQIGSSESFGQKFITGKVVEKGSGEVLPYAAVQILGSGKGTTTNSDGYFTLINPGRDSVNLVVQYVGYQNHNLTLSPGESREELLVELEPLSIQLDEVVISSETFKFINPATGISQTTISTKQLYQLPNVGEVDIFRSLQLLPGVSGTNENSSGLFVRGGGRQIRTWYFWMGWRFTRWIISLASSALLTPMR